MPNPIKNFRYEREDWDDFFENDYDYQQVDSDDETSKKCKNPRLYKKSTNSGLSSKPLKPRRNPRNGSTSCGNSMVPNVDDVDPANHHFNNPPGEFEIGVWKPE